MYIPEIIEFNLTKLIDKIKVSFNYWHFETIKKRLDALCPLSATYKHDSGLWRHYDLDGSLVQLVIWAKNKYKFSIFIQDPTTNIQKTFIDKILQDTPRTLSEVEFAYIFTPNNADELPQLRQIIETGLFVRGVDNLNFNREDNTSYYGPYGRIRSYEIDGKRRIISLGVRIYSIPKDAEIKKSLKLEVVMGRDHITDKLSHKESLTEPVHSSDITLEDYIEYRILDAHKLSRKHLFRAEERKLRSKWRKEKGLKNKYIEFITKTRNNNKKLCDETDTAATVFQYRKLKKFEKHIGGKIKSFFPLHPKQYHIFENIEHGFVLIDYTYSLACLSCTTNICEDTDYQYMRSLYLL